VHTCIWPSWCHCHSLTLASVKSRLVLPFWYRLTRVVPDKGLLNVCSSSKSSRFSVLICDCLTSDELFCNEKNLGRVSETAAVLVYWRSAAMKSCLSQWCVAWKSALWQVNGTCLLFWSSANSRIGLRLGLVWVNAHTGWVKKVRCWF